MPRAVSVPAPLLPTPTARIASRRQMGGFSDWIQNPFNYLDSDDDEQKAEGRSEGQKEGVKVATEEWRSKYEQSQQRLQDLQERYQEDQEALQRQVLRQKKRQRRYLVYAGGGALLLTGAALAVGSSMN